MMRVSLSLLIWLVPVAHARADQLRPPHEWQGSAPIAITHVTVIDVVNGRRIGDRTVEVRGRRILSVADGRAAPHAGARVVDGRGKFLIPGLWDMHAHAVRDTPNTLPLFIANGITGLRDMGDDLDSTMAAAARDRSGPQASPRLVLAGAIIDGAPTIYPDVSVTARTPAEGRHWVDSLARRGVDFIKAYEMLRPEVVAAIVDEARLHHLAVVGHAPLTMNAGTVSELGYRSLEHLRNVDVACSSIADSLIAAATDQLEAGARDGRPGGAVRGAIFSARSVRLLATFDPARCDALLRRFRRNDTWQVPTFVVADFYFTRSDTTQRVRARLRFLPPSTRDDWMKASHALDTEHAALAARLGGTASLDDVSMRTRARYHEIFRRMLALGVPVLAGTDFGNPWVTPGFSLHDELTLFVQDGMSPLDALRSATSSPARFLGATDSLGTIAPGKLADLVLLDADPLLDIDNTRRIRAVVADGRLFDRTALDAILATAERVGRRATVPLVADSLPRIDANDNRVPAGRESRGVLHLRLEARLGRWYPQADSGPTEPVQAFGEEGKRPVVPGPLVRVRAGTRIEITLRNTLAGRTLVVYGLHARPGSPRDTVQVAAGATRTVHFAAGEPGTYFYWGSTTGDDIDHRKGIDSQLSGAIIVDSATSDPRRPRDRVFVIGVWHADSDTTGPKPWVERDQMVINGKSWPYTERFRYSVGDSVQWRWVNPTADAHTMHLHGFYYTVQSAGTWSGDTVYARADRREVVTELMLPGGTMAIQWVPHAPGNWLFHCHFPFHVSEYLSLDKMPDASDPEAMGHGVHTMAGMVLGVRVLAARSSRAMIAPRSAHGITPRAIRLLIQATHTGFVTQSAAAAADTTPRYAFVVQAGSEPVPLDSVPTLSPTLVLRRDQPVRITLVNHLRAPTAVHWHGIEVEDSYYDGVPGWSGTPDHLAPAIAPGDSFVVRFTPPRAGTFMYHSHSNENWQIAAGLYGAIVVTDATHPYDTATSRTFVLGGNGPDHRGARVNGSLEPAPETLTVGTTYRLRIVEINPDWRVLASMVRDSSVLVWRAVAKDGADLPPHQRVMRPARVLMGPGETADFEFTPTAVGTLRLDFTTVLPGWTLAVPLHVRAGRG